MSGLRFGVAAWALALVACARDPLPWICPDLAPGDLVVSELRGAQTGADSYGQWIELYNASPAAIPLAGARLALRRIDGSGEVDLLVRDDLTVSAGEYAVLGRFEPGAEPAWIDYGFAGDFDSDLYDGGELVVWACDVEVDRAVWRDLPDVGTLGVDGVDAPDADANDDDSAWCADEAPGDDPTQLGTPGTPGARNRPC